VSALERPCFVADATSQTLVTRRRRDARRLLSSDGAVGAGRFAVGCSSGAIAEWLQIEEAAFHSAAGLTIPSRPRSPRPFPAQIMCEGMEEVSPGFYRCGEQAMILVPPPTGRVPETPLC
jgi:hypothetical protein